MKNDTGLKRNLSWTTAGMVMYNMAVWVFSVLILNMLGAEASGYYAIAVSVGNTLYALSLWGLRSFIAADAENKYSADEYFSARMAGIAAALVILGIVLAVSRYDAAQNSILILYTLYKCSEAAIEVLDCFCQRRLQMNINAGSMILRSILFTVIFYLSLRFTASMNTAFALLVIAALAVMLLYNLPRVRRIEPMTCRIRWNSRTVEILKQTFPIMAFELLSALAVALPRLFFERTGSLSELGIYTTIYTLVVFLQLVINVMIYTFAPYMAKAYSAGDRKTFGRYCVMLFGGSLALGLLAEAAVAIMGKPVIGLVFGAEAAARTGYLYLGILSGVSLTYTWIFSQIFVVVHRSAEQLKCSLISVAACFVLSALLVKAESCDSMSVVLILSNIIFMAVSLYLLRDEAAKLFRTR